MAYVEQAADYITGDVVTASEYNQTMSNIIYNHDTSRAFKNRLINGNFIIDEYSGGLFSGTATNSNLNYCIDRWICYPVGADVTAERVAGSDGRKYHYQITGAASVSEIQFVQRIEAANCYDLAGGEVTVSVWLANSVLSEVNWLLRYAGTENDFSSMTSIDTGTWTVDSTMKRYTVTVDVPEAAKTGLHLRFGVGAQTSGTWKIGNVQLEAGDTATDFDVREVGTELATCQEYATRWVIVYGPTASTTYVSGTWILPARRRTPTLYYKDLAGNASKISAGGSHNIAFSAGGFAVTTNSLRLDAAVTPSITDGSWFGFSFRLDNEL